MLLVTTALSGLMAGAIQTAPVPPQQPVAPVAAAKSDPDAYELDTVTTTAPRLRGSVNSDIPPDITLTAEQIQAYGASNIAELLSYLEPVTRSSRGRADGQPVLLVNGRRISGFREIQGIPPEAIERMEILPEEVALEYGYRADQRVVNFVLKNDFRSLTAELSGRGPTQGGRTTTEIKGNNLNISGPTRWSMDAEHERSSPLYESERDIVRERVTGDPGTEDIGAYRTLLAQSERSTVRGAYKRDLNSTTQATVSGSLEDRSSRSFNGLPGVNLTLPAGNPYSTSPGNEPVFRFLDAPNALGRETDSLTGGLGVLFDGFLGESWRWTLSGNYDRVETDTLTGRGFSRDPFQARLTANDPTADPFGALSPADFNRLADDTANSVSQVLATELVLNGDVYRLPAGGVSSTFKFGADTRSLDSTSLRDGQTTERSQSRDRFNGQANFSIPMASRRQDVLPALGDLSANFNVGYEELSDFGGLSTFGFGLNWSPIEPLSLNISYTDENGAPSISQLNDPTISTFNVPVFDFRTNQTVLVTRTDGGNPNLNADNRQVWKAGFNLKPWSETDLRFSSTWTYSLTEDAIASFPSLTPDLEAALPGRFTRVGGVLTSFDARPLNFERFERQDIRTGFNYSRAFGTPNPTAAALPGGARPPGIPGGGMPMRVEVRTEGGGAGGPSPGGGGGQVRMGGGGGRGGGMQPGQGRFNLSIYHTWRLQDEILIAGGLPVLDLLDGAATGARGGSPRHEIQAQGGVFRNGMGAFVHANWRDGTRVDGGTGPDINFSDQATVNLNVFIDLNSRTSWVGKFPWLKGARVNLGVQNLFDSRPEVTSSAGGVPLNYQSDYLDPQGRVVSLTFRKILF
ncbi:MAG: TonB-dependent receptor plug domain-containing protein [Brevundimonas sp.]|uniref:TonB-dependent receptor plug domain-containing protein n=1 Tax=Brevundimonas sp. TaxID=1871086 RepID=UPI002721DDAF|nr:TonB-dependent receptor plug domain-containing protein [Brevundimonas sp.]MDO9587024.1 TonB-dependent receptor plug domain-containing protein [Brevundimonas sp.]